MAEGPRGRDHGAARSRSLGSARPGIEGSRRVGRPGAGFVDQHPGFSSQFPGKENGERMSDNRSAASSQLIVHHPSGETEGRDPRSLDPGAMAAAGHVPQPLLKVIREKCRDCCCGQAGEVRKCTAVACPLWPYRNGQNPFAKPRGLPPPRADHSSQKSPLIATISGGAGPSAGGRP